MGCHSSRLAPAEAEAPGSPRKSAYEPNGIAGSVIPPGGGEQGQLWWHNTSSVAHVEAGEVGSPPPCLSPPPPTKNPRMQPKTTLRASQRSLSGGNRQHVLRGGGLRFTQSESDVGKHAVAPTVKPKASADDRAATPTNTERPWIHETMWVAGQTAATAKAPPGRRRSRQLAHPSVPKLGSHPDGDVALVRFRSRSSSNVSLTFSSPRTQGAAAGVAGSPSRWPRSGAAHKASPSC